MSDKKAERFFEKGKVHPRTPGEIAQREQAKDRHEAYRVAKVANDRLRYALASLYDLDCTGNFEGALNHVITRRDQLVDALRILENVSKPFVEKQAKR